MKLLLSLDVSPLIQILNKSKLIAECPHCGDEFALSKALLFDGRGEFPSKAESKRLELLEELKESTRSLLELEVAKAAHKVKNALHDLYNEEKIKLISHNNKHFVTLSKYYYSEQGVAQRLKTLLAYPHNSTINIDKAYQYIRIQQHERDLVLNEQQQKGVLSCLQNKVTVITGGTGTGKTTLIKNLLHVLDKEKVRYKLAAPTGRAAKRITEGTGKHASTLHRLF